MPVMEGVITIVQESRFQLTDMAGISHFFLLGHASMAEPEQLVPLQRDATHVRVTYSQPRNIIGMVVKFIELPDVAVA